MIKICGIRSIEEAKQLAKLDIDYFGLIFAPSKRQVSLDLAKEIASIFKNHSKKIVAVFTHENQIKEVCDKIDFDMLQMHNDFSLNFCNEVLEKYPNTKIWRVFRVSKTLPDFSEFKNIFERQNSNILPMFDSFGKQMGGNSKSFDWSLLKGLKEKSFILAGGLDENNCIEACALNPLVLDFNSGVESNNKKDLKKVQNLINLIRKIK